MDKIAPFLWYNDQALEAAEFYTSIFKNCRVLRVTKYPEGAPTDGNVGQPGTVMMVEFELEGRNFVALNGGTAFHFTEAISLMVNVETQEELDEIWTKLSAGGKEVQCGWLQDKFGLSWQICPQSINDMYYNGTPEQASRVFKAMMGMVKLDIAALRAAYDGE